MRHTGIVAALALLALAGCSKPKPPVGKWEGATQAGGVIVVARMEIGPDGLVKVSAPDITNADGKPEQLLAMRARLAADLATGWDGVAGRSYDFDGENFRKPGHIAEDIKWDKTSNQMTLEIYIGANPALPVPLRPVDGFHDDPFVSG